MIRRITKRKKINFNEHTLNKYLSWLHLSYFGYFSFSDTSLASKSILFNSKGGYQFTLSMKTSEKNYTFNGSMF